MAAANIGDPSGAWMFEHHWVIMNTVALLTAAYFLVFYVFGSFRYALHDGSIEMRRIVLGFLPVSRRKLDLEEVEGATIMPFLRCLTSGKGFHVFGNIFARRGVGILLRRGVVWGPLWSTFGKTVYVTPRDPDAFVAQVQSALDAGSDSDPQGPLPGP